MTEKALTPEEVANAEIQNSVSTRFSNLLKITDGRRRHPIALDAPDGEIIYAGRNGKNVIRHNGVVQQYYKENDEIISQGAILNDDIDDQSYFVALMERISKRGGQGIPEQFTLDLLKTAVIINGEKALYEKKISEIETEETSEDVKVFTQVNRDLLLRSTAVQSSIDLLAATIEQYGDLERDLSLLVNEAGEDGQPNADAFDAKYGEGASTEYEISNNAFYAVLTYLGASDLFRSISESTRDFTQALGAQATAEYFDAQTELHDGVKEDENSNAINSPEKPA